MKKNSRNSFPTRRSLRQFILGLIFRHPVPGTSIIPILPDGRIVLIRRRDTGQWALPGGMVNWREDIPRTIRRELAEETGLQLVKIRNLVGVYSAPDRDPRLHSICVVVAAEVRGEIRVRDKLEISEAKAFRAENLPRLEEFSYDNGQQLKNYLDGVTVLR
ncbi:NUDIX hydrolase [Candidatus Gracilibacteria bacterium]|nr:NUDIX hydrolase [Candidatus Gracilibacteria bacterium]NJM86015.1 NUDIX hydrolase [Hydrococcus sp. RU_2_2]